MKTTLKKIASLLLIFVMVITVSSVTAEPLPITGDGDLSASRDPGTIDRNLPISGDGDLLSSGTACFTLVYIDGFPVLIPIVI